MKNVILGRVAAGMLLFSMASVPAEAANIIINGGFETGVLSPWFQDRDFANGGVDWATTTTDAHSGRFSATDIGNKEIRQNFAGVAVARITNASFWLRHPTTTGLPAFVSLFYSDNTNTGFLVNTATTGWEQFNVLSNLSVGKTLTGFSIFGYSGGPDPNATFLDDVEFLATIPEPAAWAMMLAGFGFVGGMMRRRSHHARIAYA